jgi:hypothetical protein
LTGDAIRLRIAASSTTESEFPEPLRARAGAISSKKFMFLLSCFKPQHDRDSLAVGTLFWMTTYVTEFVYDFIGVIGVAHCFGSSARCSEASSGWQGTVSRALTRARAREELSAPKNSYFTEQSLAAAQSE